MRIGLLIAFAGRNCGGPEVYERETVRSLIAQAPGHEYHLYCLDKRGPSVLGIDSQQAVIHSLVPPVRAVSMMTSLPLAMSRTRPEVFHAIMIPPPLCPRNTIVSMPCSSLMRHPEFYPFAVRMRLRFLLHRAVPKAAKVICVSQHVKDVTQEYFGLPEERLTVIYPGVNPSFRMISPEEKRAHMEAFGIRSPFFLFSGRWEKRKNVIRTLEAFALFKRTWRTDHKLVLTGGQSWGSSEAKAALARLAPGDSVIDVGKTGIDELPYIYGAADAIVYASQWEGFGMPIIEAMACGTPVITSNVSAMPETAGGCALLVNPDSTEEMAEAMHRIVTDAPMVNQMRQKGLIRARQFTWDAAARAMLNLYEETGSRRARRAQAGS